MKNKNIILFLLVMLSNLVLRSQDSIHFELVKNINQYSENGQYDESSYPHFLTSLGDKFVFVAFGDSVGNELYISDGTENGTYLLKNINSYHQTVSNPYDNSSYPNELTKLGNKIIFYADDDIYGYEPWITDGTPDGTHILKDINAGEYASYPENFYYYNEKLFFGADDTGSMIRSLYVTDGTEQNTYKLKDINNEDVLNPSDFYQYNGILYFSAEESSDSKELWRTDGTTGGTYMLKNLCNEYGGSYPSEFIEYNNLLFFSAQGDSTGIELWVSDGTEGGTYIYKNINEFSGNGSNPSNFIVFNNKLYFTADDGVNGRRIWVIDGDTTHITLDVLQNNYSYNYSRFFKFKNLLFFTLNVTEFGDKTLWCTDGTSENTFELKAYDNTSVENPERFIEWNNKVYFIGQRQNTENNQIWSTDGTIANTKQLFDDSISGWNPVGSFGLFLFENEIYLSAIFDINIGYELYKITDKSVSDIKKGNVISDVIEVYPNPSAEIISIKFKNKKSNSNIFIYITDVNGKIMYKRRKMSENIENINISKFRNGLYLVVLTDSGRKYYSKFIKQ